MRRRPAVLAFSGVLSALAVVAAAPRTRAAEPAPSRWVAAPANEPLLVPMLAKHEPPIFGSFLDRARPAGAPSGDAACPPDMVTIDGDYCPWVEQRCRRWLDPATMLQCAEFEPSAGRCFQKTQHRRFCVDRYEWPNRAGALPTSMASWNEATATCASAGKRLCSDVEWTLACEGPERHPYPYGTGFERDASACNIDKPYVWPRPERVYDPKTRDDELARLDQREPSGARAACVSPYGVHDMAGNVDEWVVNESQRGFPHASALKGGYWGPVRTRCRPMTTDHPATFRYYQTGFRCCDDARVPTYGAAPLASR